MEAGKTIAKVLAERVLVCDGAMGTQLQAAGMEPGSCGESWNLRFPERVLAIQRAYVEAGSDCLTTNTFGGCRLALRRHGLEEEVQAVNRQAVEIARQAFDPHPGFVLGDIGPFGGLMEPYGTVSPAEVRTGFLEQTRVLVGAGVDAILIETMTSLEEMSLALEAAQEAGAPLVIASMSFDSIRDGKDFRTMMGVSPEQAAEAMQGAGAGVAGTNCGSGVEARHAVEILRRFRTACDLPLLAQPNAGSPELVDGRIIYHQSPAELAVQVGPLLGVGARMVGACCGSTPEHIAAIRKEVRQSQGDVL